MLAVMYPPTPPTPSSFSVSVRKRPRGLWKRRRDHAAPADRKSPTVSHGVPSTVDTDFEDDHRVGDFYDDDLDEDNISSSSSGSKRRRLSSTCSKAGSPWRSPLGFSRSLTPELYHAPIASPPVTTLANMVKSTITTTATNPSSSTDSSKTTSMSDYEDWENLKVLFSRAAELCDSDDILEALPLLRAVIRECHRLLSLHPDPSVIYAGHAARQSPSTHSPVEIITPTDERNNRDWTKEFDTAVKSSAQRHRHSVARTDELPTAFHATFGIALFLIGNIIAQDPSLALPDEPSAPSTYWLAALDVFETGESLPCLTSGRPGGGSTREDWRMAIAWGRTLVCLADAKVELSETHAELPPSNSEPQSLQDAWASISNPSPFELAEPTWPKDSPFYAIQITRPPVTRRMSLYSASAHDIMVLATDQFSRGIFHMPHPSYPHSHNPTHINTQGGRLSHTATFPNLASDVVYDPSHHHHHHHSHQHTSLASPDIFSPSLPASYFKPVSFLHSHARSQTSTHSTSTFSRPRELFTIASEVLGVAERLPETASREYWATWADSVFNQMKMEADMDMWRSEVMRARGRCWLVVGSARAEEVEDALEKGEPGVFDREEAVEAREALDNAITFFERARHSASGLHEAEDLEAICPLLAEALLTLANLTSDCVKRDELYARAQQEGGDDIILDSSSDASEVSSLPPAAPTNVEEDFVMADDS